MNLFKKVATHNQHRKIRYKEEYLFIHYIKKFFNVYIGRYINKYV